MMGGVHGPASARSRKLEASQAMIMPPCTIVAPSLQASATAHASGSGPDVAHLLRRGGHRSVRLAQPRCRRGLTPKGPHVLGQSLPDLADLALGHMPAQDRKHGPGRLSGVDGPRRPEVFRCVAPGLLKRATSLRLVGEMPMIVVGSTPQKRQLGPEVDGNWQRHTITEGA